MERNNRIRSYTDQDFPENEVCLLSLNEQVKINHSKEGSGCFEVKNLNGEIIYYVNKHKLLSYSNICYKIFDNNMKEKFVLNFSKCNCHNLCDIWHCFKKVIVQQNGEEIGFVTLNCSLLGIKFSMCDNRRRWHLTGNSSAFVPCTRAKEFSLKDTVVIKLLTPGDLQINFPRTEHGSTNPVSSILRILILSAALLIIK